MVLIFIFALLFACRVVGSVYTPAIVTTAIAHGVDPQVALAIVEVESSFNPKARGSKGEVGLFQLHPKYHKVSRDEYTNIKTAIAYIAHIEPRCRAKYGQAWIVCYNYGPTRTLKAPEKTRYYKKVTRAIRAPARKVALQCKQ